MNLEYEGSRVSYLGVAVTVFISVLFANLLSLLVVKIYLDYEAKQAMVLIDKQIKSNNDYFNRQQESFRKQQIQLQNDLATKQRQAQIEAEQRKNAARIKRQTCEFWNQQLASNKTDYNRLMREKACQ